MGLDCLWKDKNNDDASVDREFNVCGGICSDNGTTSFRGKVYLDLVKQASGVSLYQDIIDNETCREILECLEKFDLNEYHNPWNLIEKDEFEDLKEMFRAHVEKGHHLVGWW